MPINSFDDYPMSWRPDLSGESGPKYMAIVNKLEKDIKSGALRPGTKLPPQRELADFLDVNLSTVFRAFKLCEQRGLLSASVGSGTFVSSDATSEQVLLSRKEGAQSIEMGAIIPGVKANLKVKQYLEGLLKRPDALTLFSYGVPEGTRRHREAGAIWFQKAGFQTDSGHIALAAGGQNALMAALGTFFKSGDRVGADPLTFSGAKTAAKLLGIQLIPIQGRDCEMTEEGLRYAIQNENIKGIYVIPDYHNPTTHVMSLETRIMIARIAQETKLIVIEDAINSALMEHPMPPIAAFAPEQTVCLSSLSKSVSAGLRTAFVHVPDAYYPELVNTLYSMNTATSPLLATVSAGLIEDGIADEIVAERKREIAERNRIVNEVLAGFSVVSELSCPFRYIRLPEHFTGQSFEICANAAGVQLYGAERFAVGNKPVEKAVRISVTTPATIEDLTEAIHRLRELLQK